VLPSHAAAENMVYSQKCCICLLLRFDVMTGK